jgi:hypothetical protein
MRLVRRGLPVEPGCRASRNRGKAAQVHGLCAFGFQEIVQKSMVADLIIRVVVNVLRHVAIQDLEGGGIERIPAIDS